MHRTTAATVSSDSFFTASSRLKAVLMLARLARSAIPSTGKFTDDRFMFLAIVTGRREDL